MKLPEFTPRNILIGTGILAVGAMLFWKREAVVETAQQITSSGVTYAQGLRTSHSGIRVSDRQVAFMKKLRRATSSVLIPDMVVTSGIRDEFGQAKAMLDYVRDYGVDRFKKLYGKAATELLAVSPASWPEKVKTLYANGLLNKGGHYGGGAIDVRKGDADQTKEIIRAALSIGAKEAYDDGPAVHIDLPA